MELDNKQVMIILVIVVVGIILLYGNFNIFEGYDSATYRNNESRNVLANYYLWRPFGNHANDRCIKKQHPFTYYPHAHPMKYTDYY